MSGAQPAIHGPRLAVDVAGLVAGQEQGDARDLVGAAGALGGVQLADLALCAAGARGGERRRRHAGLDEPRAQRVDAHARARELERRRLRQRDHGRLGRRVRRGAGVGAQARHRGCADDAPRGRGFGRGRLLHGGRGVLGGEEDAAFMIC